jgi:ATP-dependent Clp protease ATP-binding subunit ClpB
MQFGARPLKRLLQKKILDGLSIALLDGTILPGMHVQADVGNGVVQFNR